MSLKNDVVHAQQDAMKNKETEKLSILRMLSAAIKNAEIKKQSELTDDEVQDVIRIMVNQSKDALLDFEKGGRADLVKQNKSEIDFLSQYLPNQLSDEDIEQKVRQILKPLGTKESLNFGMAMGIIMKELKGQADGDKVRGLLNKYLEKE